MYLMVREYPDPAVANSGSSIFVSVRTRADIPERRASPWEPNGTTHQTATGQVLPHQPIRTAG
jgi:hypothetical protein